jgi:hypothetical protein
LACRPAEAALSRPSGAERAAIDPPRWPVPPGLFSGRVKTPGRRPVCQRVCGRFFTHHFQITPQAIVFERFFVFGSAFDIVAKYLISLNFSLLLR